MKAMLPNLFVSLLAITAGLLFHQNRNLHQTNSSLNQALKEQNLQVREQQLEMMKGMRINIMEELRDWGRKTNVGLLDTLDLIQIETDSLLSNSHISDSMLTNFVHGQKAIIRSILAKPEAYLWPLDTGFVNKKSTQEVTRNYVLSWEFETLNLLNSRLGVGGGCRLPRLGINLERLNQDIIFEGDTFRQKIELKVVEGYVNYTYIDKIEKFRSSVGYVERNEDGSLYLCVPTKNLLDQNEDARVIHYTIEGKLIKATGGFETISGNDSFLLVRPSK